MKDTTKFKINLLSLGVFALLIGFLFPPLFDNFLMIIQSDGELWDLKIFYMVLLSTFLSGWLMFFILNGFVTCVVETINLKRRK